MFGRRLRSRLDLVWPLDQVHSKVVRKQQIQKDHHVHSPRQVNLPVNSPVMVRDYAMQRPKWVPGFIQQQTGPLSYRCSLANGEVVKRHQDQIHTRTLPPKEDAELEPGVQNNPPITGHEGGGSEGAPSTVPSRRSQRVRRPVEKLNL